MVRGRASLPPLLLVALALLLSACSDPPPRQPDPRPQEACTEPTEVVTFPDPDLRSFIYLRLGLAEGQPILCGALDVVTQLNLRSSRNVRSLEGVQHLRSVNSISFEQQNQLPNSEFARLGALTTVTSVSIDQAALLTSVKFVENMADLEFLMVDDADLGSLDGVQDHALLRTVYLRGNPKLKSIDQLGTLPALTSLQLIRSAVSTLTPLSGSETLVRLMATNNALTSVDVRDLPLLEELQVTSNQIGALPDFSALGLPSLTLLSVANNNLTTLAGLEGMRLSFLAANTNKLGTIHHIADLAGVRTLYLNDNYLSDMTPLQTVSWGAGAEVYLGTNCLGVIYYPESGLHTLPAGPNNEAWKDLTLAKGVNVHLLPVAQDNRCS